MHNRFLLPLLVFALFLAACTPPEAPPAAPGGKDAATQEAKPAWYVASGDSASAADVLKSPADSRSYRFLTLDNGMKVLLVSDPEADKAAASLSIDVGSFENPADRDGLAHFLEHMLFLGTDKYPEAGEYQAFLNEHGGSFNAYTSLEETNYFFDVDVEYLLPTLDRFSRFFVAPLFNEEYVDRERHAVDSEYQLKIKDDSRREWDVLSELANPAHPFSRFSVGNLDTLANTPENPVREDLLAFYNNYYSASRMNLVVLGKQTLDELEHEVTGRFAEVPGHEVVLDEEAIPLFSTVPARVQIRPEKELRHISFNFPLPRVAGDWRTKPVEYLSHLLGHEGEGSLLHDLKQRGLAEGLRAGLVYDSRHGALFSVQINLTPKGVQQEKTVSQDFFRWLELVREKGVEQWRYDEVARLSEQAFRFAEKQPPMNYVRQLSTDLHLLPPGDILRGNFLYESFDGDHLRTYAQYLSPDNVVVVLTAPEVETDRASRLYRAPYKVEKLQVDKLQVDSLAASDSHALRLPEPNPYIAEKLDLVVTGPVVDKPVQSAGVEGLWFYPDSVFKSPKGYFEARVTLPGMGDIQRAVMLDYLVALVSDQLNAQAYPAMLAGLGFALSPWEDGFTITLTGYSEKQQVLLKRILQALRQPEWDEARLARVKSTLARNLRNTTKEWPLRQLFNRFAPLLLEAWLPTEKADVLDGITTGQLKAFHGELFGSGKGRFYAGGNYLEADAQAMAREVNVALGLLEKDVAATVDVRNLARTETLPATYYYVDHDDSAALLYLQGDDDSVRERALFSLINNILQAPFYSTLRTEKQLGYAVGSSLAPLQRVPGAMFYVQSPKVDADTLRTEINGFLEQFGDTVKNMSDSDLERYRQSVLAKVEEKPQNLNELAARHLESLNLGYGDFDFRERLAEEVRRIGREELQVAYGRVVTGERAGLWILTTEDEKTGNGSAIGADFIEGIFSYSD